jgi:tetratricopeptide (TPR) repeat protein
MPTHHSSSSALLDSMLATKLRQALSLHQAGRLAQARSIYEDILKFQPSHADALHFLGVVENHNGNHARAVNLIERSISIFPRNPSSHLNLGNAQKELRQFQAALVSYDKAIALKPDYVVAYLNRGAALQAIQRFDEAVAAFDTAITLKPDYAEAYFNRGNVLKDMGRMEAAIASYDTAISFVPGFADAHLNRGSALMELSQFDFALKSFETAAVLRPDHADAHWNRSLLLLLTGNFMAGWPLHEWRWKLGNADRDQRNFVEPLWLGRESIQGKTVLLYGEQGLGDSIQFVRFVRHVANLGAHVVLEAPLQLKDLFKSVEGVGTLTWQGQALPAFDFHCPLLSLPLALNVTLDTIPNGACYLQANTDRLQHWSHRLGPTPLKRVGLAWSGNAKHGNDHNRSVPLSTFVQSLPAGIEYVSLQKELRDSDRTILDKCVNIRHFGPELADFSDTAALCELVDLVISVDTSVAHLAGALGKPVWILLPHVPDWRWLLGREDSPWYATASLYRQASPRDWGSALGKVHADLLTHDWPSSLSRKSGHTPQEG